MSGDAVRKNVPLELFFFFDLFGPNRPHIPLSFFFWEIEPSLWKLFTFAHWVSYVLDELITHLFFLYFHVTTVTLVNFILMCLKETRTTLWFSTVKYLISNLFVNSLIMSPSLSVNNALVRHFDTLLSIIVISCYCKERKKYILYTKHINSIHKKREDKPPPCI